MPLALSNAVNASSCLAGGRATMPLAARSISSSSLVKSACVLAEAQLVINVSIRWATFASRAPGVSVRGMMVSVTASRMAKCVAPKNTFVPFASLALQAESGTPATPMASKALVMKPRRLAPCSNSLYISSTPNVRQFYTMNLCYCKCHSADRYAMASGHKARG